MRGINAHFLGMCLDILHRTLQVIECIRISIATEDIPIRSHESPYACRPIVQNESRNTIALQPLAHILTLSLHVMPQITTTRTNNNGNISLAFCQVWRHHNSLSNRRSLPYIDPLWLLLLCKGAEREEQCHYNKHIIFLHF